MSKINSLRFLSLLIASCWAYFLISTTYSTISGEYQATFGSIYGQFADQHIEDPDGKVRGKFLSYFYEDIVIDFFMALTGFSLAILAYRFTSCRKVILGLLAVIYIAGWVYVNRFFSIGLNEVIQVKLFVIKQTGIWLPIFISDFLFPLLSLFSLLIVGGTLINSQRGGDH